LLGLVRIVENDEVGSPSRAAARGGDELGTGILCGAHGWEEGPIPRCIDDHAKLAMQLGSELARVAHDDDAAGWIVAEQPSDIRDRDADRFQGANCPAGKHQAGPFPWSVSCTCLSSALLTNSTESIAAPSWVRNCSIASFIGGGLSPHQLIA